jgi:DNA-binding NtrC family response regulator
MSRVLVVDDEDRQRRTIERTVQEVGYDPGEIDSVANEDEARRLIHSKEKEYELAIIDLMLSAPPVKKEGLRLVEELSREQPACRIIGLTTKAGLEEGVEMMDKGAHDFVHSASNVLPWLELLEQRVRLWRGLIAKRRTPLAVSAS